MGNSGGTARGQRGTASTGALLAEACFGDGETSGRGEWRELWMQTEFHLSLFFFLLMAQKNIGNVELAKRSSRLISMSTR